MSELACLCVRFPSNQCAGSAPSEHASAAVRKTSLKRGGIVRSGRVCRPNVRAHTWSHQMRHPKAVVGEQSSNTHLSHGQQGAQCPHAVVHVEADANNHVAGRLVRDKVADALDAHGHKHEGQGDEDDPQPLVDVGEARHNGEHAERARNAPV